MVSAAWEVGTSGRVAFAPEGSADENIPGAAGSSGGGGLFARFAWAASSGGTVLIDWGALTLAELVAAEAERDET
jgi:hypothetical protein